MDYETARRLIIDQSDATNPASDVFLARLRTSQAPIPGQVTSILLALKVVFDTLKGEKVIDRELAYALHVIASDGRRLFETGLRRSTNCPPLLHEDLERIAKAVKSIFSGTWQA